MCHEAKKYEQALFHAHLAIEKALKARFIDENDDAPPYTHELNEIAAQTSLQLSDDQKAILREMSRLAVRARYADHQWSEEQANAQNSEYWLARSDELYSLIMEK